MTERQSYIDEGAERLEALAIEAMRDAQRLTSFARRILGDDRNKVHGVMKKYAVREGAYGAAEVAEIAAALREADPELMQSHVRHEKAKERTRKWRDRNRQIREFVNVVRFPRS